jgi:hypothetical protein
LADLFSNPISINIPARPLPIDLPLVLKRINPDWAVKPVTIDKSNMTSEKANDDIKVMQYIHVVTPLSFKYAIVSSQEGLIISSGIVKPIIAWLAVKLI